MATFPPELKRYRLLVVGSSLFLAGVGGVSLFLALSPGSSERSPIPFVLFAIVAFAVSAFGLFFVPRWYRRAAHIVSTTPPLPGFAILTLEADSESTALYAMVSTPDPAARPLERIALLIPRWKVQPLLGASLSVGLHIDPSSSRLMAISTEHGVLWCMPTGTVVRRSSATSGPISGA
jgi:hypothetical protein